MLNDILDGVTQRINELFGDDYEIYTDEVQQGLKEPCFFVQFMEPAEKPMIGQRYFRQTYMYIQYMPGEVLQPNRELNRVADVLMDGMEYITLADGSLLRGTGRSHRREDGILTFFVSYNLFILKIKSQEESMEGLENEVQLRRRDE